MRWYLFYRFNHFRSHCRRWWNMNLTFNGSRQHLFIFCERMLLFKKWKENRKVRFHHDNRKKNCDQTLTYHIRWRCSTKSDQVGYERSKNWNYMASRPSRDKTTTCICILYASMNSWFESIGWIVLRFFFACLENVLSFFTSTLDGDWIIQVAMSIFECSKTFH